MSPGSKEYTRNVGCSAGENCRQLIERGFGRSVATPPGVRLDGRVGADVDDRAAAGEQRGQNLLDQRERRGDIHSVDVCQLGERIVGELRLRARPEMAGVVHEQVKPTE